MKTDNNEYQVSKTIRFGLTIIKKKNKDKDKPYIQSHNTLLDLIEYSQQKIIKELDTKKKNLYSQELPIEDIRTCFNQMKDFINQWEGIYSKYNQIAVTKEFYRKLERKARFDGFWLNNKGQKTPQSQIIKLSILREAYLGKLRKDYIIDYWKNHIEKTKQKFKIFEVLLQDYEDVIKIKRDDKKLNQVQFRKLFLPLTKLVYEILIPLSNQSICFPDIQKNSENESNKSFEEFACNDWLQLHNLIQNIKNYFEEHGGYVSYGKVTLNKYTAMQKPHQFSIETVLKPKNEQSKNIFIDIEFIKHLVKNITQENYLTYVSDCYESIDNKIQRFEDSKLSSFERVQLFKYKSIPVDVRVNFAEFLEKKYKIPKDKVLWIFDTIGKPKLLGLEYNQNKQSFNLLKYPIKQSFDFAWETLAMSYFTKTDDLLKKECENFLKLFNVYINSEVMQEYSLLLHLKIHLQNIDYHSPKNRQEYIFKAKQILDAFIEIQNNKNKDSNNAKVIYDWIYHSEIKQKTEKNNKSNIFKDYETAKQKIGLYRGGLKNSVQKYKNLTNRFKELSSNFGKGFAELRDKFNEESELNKISHYGMILEDSFCDRYILLHPLNYDREEVTDIFDTCTNGDIKTYKVKSLTSKALHKLMSNKRGCSNDFHDMNIQKPLQYLDDVHSNINPKYIEYIKNRLINSSMAKQQKWDEFGWDFSQLNSYELIEKEVDSKGYILQSGFIDKKSIEVLVKEKNCLLLPFVNQDIISDNKDNKEENQFTKDWKKIFEQKDGFRFHPEFKIVYRYPTPDYPKPEEKRYSRFQMIAHILCEIIPRDVRYISLKEQIEFFNDEEKQKQSVDIFNKNINNILLKNDFYIFGIDRGISQLATLCVLDKTEKICGDFEIFTRYFDTNTKQWIHSFSEKRNFLDLSNLRVETTITGTKVLVDLSSIKVKDENGAYTLDNLQKIKLKQLAYIRKLQYQMQFNEDKVVNFIKQYKTESDIEKNIKELISPYKEGIHYSDLPIKKINELLQEFYNACEKKDEKAKQAIFELDSADDLKTGIVGNMIGVISFLLELYNYNVYISLENLYRALYPQVDGLNAHVVANTNQDKEIDFKKQENLCLAGLGTYHYFEMQLLKKLFKLPIEKNIFPLIPCFRSVDSYENICKIPKNSKTQYVYKPFGIVNFVDPMYTTSKCPICGSTGKSISRNRNKNDEIECKKCSYKTSLPYNQKIKFIQDKKNLQNKNIDYIVTADENAAYHIALKILINLGGKI